jgi:DNA repair exonuclease SbcCD ATPase subunit
MKVNIKKLHLRNFFSVGNKWLTIDYRTGLYRVKSINEDAGDGGNAGGKSSCFVEGIMFGLLGKPVRKINLSDIPNTINGKKDCEVKLELSIENNNYLIHRGINPGFLKLYENYKEGDENLKKNENEKQDSAKKLTQKRIDDLIGSSFNTLSHLLIMSNSYTSSFLDLETAKKREVIEDILGIGVFGTMAENVKKEDLELKNSYNLAKKEYDLVSHNLKQYEENRLKLIEKSENFEKSKKEALEKVKQKLIKLNENIAAVKQLIIEENGFQGQIDNLNTEKKQLEKLYNSFDVNIQMAQKNGKDCQSVLEKLSKDPVCPLCATETNSDHVQQHIKQLEETVQICRNEYKSNTKLKNETAEKINKIALDIKQLDSKIMEQFELNSKYNKLKDEKEVVKSQALEIKDKKNDFLELINENEYLQKKEEINVLVTKLQMLAKEKTYSEYIRKLLSEEGIKQFIIKKVIQFWNSKVNFYLGELNAECSIYFDNNLNAVIKSRNRDPLQYHSFSGGEKARIDVAILLSVLDISKIQNSIDLNVMVVDELLDGGLDDSGREDVLNLFKQMSLKQGKSIYVISHNNNLPTHLFDKEITLYKKNGFTYF